MNRRTWTLVAACLLALTLGVLGATLPVPMVALGPGPTYNTLGEVEGAPVVRVDGLPVYPTSGHLNMTTVSVTDRLTMFSAVGLWASPESQVVPRAQVFRPDRTRDEIREQNAEQFASSEAHAESAAVAELAIPATVVVTDVLPGTPASEILQQGDELVSVGGRPLDSVEALTSALETTRPGQRVSLSYRHDGELRTADVVLSASPDGARGLLGIIPAGLARDADVEISLAGIGGPSAGLMFALSVVDKLTPRELTGGHFVAGTGAILPNGVVARIDGIAFKMRAARDAGATVFLVPDGNCAAATAGAPPGLRLVRVGTLHDAVVALEALGAGRPAATC